MLIDSFERAARHEGWKEGIAQGRNEGFSDGSHQKALKTAQILKELGDPIQKIMQATGLTKAEVESLSNG